MQIPSATRLPATMQNVQERTLLDDSEPESSDIECLINETNAKGSAGNEADILCDIAQDYDLDDQCGFACGRQIGGHVE